MSDGGEQKPAGKKGRGMRGRNIAGQMRALWAKGLIKSSPKAKAKAAKGATAPSVDHSGTRAARVAAGRQALSRYATSPRGRAASDSLSVEIALRGARGKSPTGGLEKEGRAARKAAGLSPKKVERLVDKFCRRDPVMDKLIGRPAGASVDHSGTRAARVAAGRKVAAPYTAVAGEVKAARALGDQHKRATARGDQAQAARLGGEHAAAMRRASDGFDKLKARVEKQKGPAAAQTVTAGMQRFAKKQLSAPSVDHSGTRAARVAAGRAVAARPEVQRSAGVVKAARGELKTVQAQLKASASESTGYIGRSWRGKRDAFNATSRAMTAQGAQATRAEALKATMRGANLKTQAKAAATSAAKASAGTARAAAREKRIAEIKPGDTVRTAFGTPVRVARKNKKSITTDMGTRYTFDELA